MPVSGALIFAGSLVAIGVAAGLVVAHYHSENRTLMAALARHASLDARYQAIFDDTPMGCVVWEPGFAIVEWNRQAEHIFGWPRQDILGRSFISTIVAIDSRDRFMRDAADLLAGGLSHAILAHVTRDGRPITCRWHHAVLKGRAGEPVQIVSMCVNVTAIKELQLENALFRSTMDLTDEPTIMLLDADDGARVIYASESAGRQLGRRPDDLIGKTPAEWDSNFSGAVLSDYWRALQARKSVSFETEHRHTNGRVMPVEVTLNAIEHDGKGYLAAYTRDISARRAELARLRDLEVQAAVREHEKRYREVFEHSSDALFTIEVRSGTRLAFDTVNPAAAEAFGIPAAALKGMQFGKIVDGEMGKDFGASLAEHIADYLSCALTGMPAEYEGALDLLPSPQGGGRRFHVKLLPLAGDDGIERIIGVARDTTLRTRYETGLRERARLQEQIASVAQAVPGFLFTVHIGADMRSSFPFASDGIGELFGLRPEDIRHNADALRARYHPDDLPGLLRCMEDCCRTLAPFRFELRVFHPEHGLRWIDMRATPSRLPDGTVEAHGMMIDITERKQIAAELARREREFRTLTENSPDIVVRYDRACRRTYVNPAYEAVQRMAKAEVLGRTIPEASALPATAADAIHRMIAGVVESGQPSFHEATWPTGDGKPVSYQFHAVPEFDDGGTVTSVLSVARDITALKETEARLIESRALIRQLSARREEAREYERKRVARALHEELGQILTALRINVSLLPIRFGGSAPALRPHAQAMTDLIDRAIHGLRGAVAALRPTVIDAGGIGAALEWLAREFTTHAGIACALDVPGDATLADDAATAVFRIVEEALANIERHAEASRASVALKRREAEWHLEIGDDGRGFDRRDVPDGACGVLGLEERVLSLGGSMQLESAPGSGTAIRVRFPAG